jgi:hypothetical protein
MKDKFLLYKLIGNVVYPIWPQFYYPFKGEKEELPRYKTHWNFIQSSTRMSMEKTFEMMKGRFKILLKKVNIPLHHILDLVMAHIHSHNMCIASLDGFDMDWALEAQRYAQIETNKTFGNLKRTNISRVVEEVIKQMKRLQNPKMVDGDDRNDMEDMKNMEHQGEDKNHVLTTTKKNPKK